jgi:hypothetical protein
MPRKIASNLHSGRAQQARTCVSVQSTEVSAACEAQGGDKGNTRLESCRMLNLSFPCGRGAPIYRSIR